MKIIILIKSVFSTIRSGNLIIICLSLFLIRYTLIKPLLVLDSLDSSLSDLASSILVISILFIAAGGYLINDYFDKGIDAINKPGKNKIGSTISRNSALIVYIILTFTGLLLSWYFGELAGFRYPLLVIMVCAGLLYFYSSSYKKMFLVGNIIVSLLAAFTIYLPVFFDHNAQSAAPIILLTGAYSVFAFLLTLIREIVKDCEDAEGDMTFGATTLPVVAGTGIARAIAAVLTLLTFGALLWIQIIQNQWDDRSAFIYVSFFIQLPLLFLIYKIIKAKTKSDFSFASTLAKLIMMTGILSMLVFYLTSL